MKDTIRQRQLRVGIDVTRPVLNAVLGTRSSYEFSVDVSMRKELYAVAEAGWGGSNYEYPDLTYRSSNPFLRLGVDRTMLPRLFASDWDAVFAGIRYGIAPISRGEVSFATNGTIWNVNSGKVPAENLLYHWAEITGGVRVEVLPRIMAGWNIRGKFLLAGGSNTELRPGYVAGYGKGDQSTAFDFNVWAMYTFRWNKRGFKP